MARLLVTNIGELLTIPVDGLGRHVDAALLIDDGVVRFAGGQADLPPDLVVGATVFDAAHRLVTPGLVDPHTHPIFAGARHHEFDLRTRGRGYAEIQAAGGGILSTVRATNAASDDALVQNTVARFDRFLAHGTTTLEAKSGYALSHDGELRLLRLLGEAARARPLRVSRTLLAHVPPPDLDGAAREAYVERFCAETIPTAARENLCEALDVYCDAGAFTLGETRRLLRAASNVGLRLRVHAEQFTRTGAAELAAAMGAHSVEHLEELSPDAHALLAQAGVVCNLLPGAALTLKLKRPDARALLASGCIVALGTDYNPGSSLTESQTLMMSLGVLEHGLHVDEAWCAVTRNAARAIGRDDVGTLEVGARGDFVVWDTDDHREVPQHLGANLVSQVFVDGVRVVPLRSS